LDRRVADLIQDLGSGRIGTHADGSVDYDAWTHSITALHAEVEEEEGRVELLKLYGALMGNGVETLLREGRDPAPLEDLWRSTYYRMLATEAIGPGGKVDPERLGRVNRREVEAGRMPEGTSFGVEAQPGPPPRSAEMQAAIGKARTAIAVWTEERLRPWAGELLARFRDDLARLRSEGALDWEAGRGRASAISHEWTEREEEWLRDSFMFMGPDIIDELQSTGVGPSDQELLWEDLDKTRDWLFEAMREALDEALERRSAHSLSAVDAAQAQPSRLLSGQIHPEDYPPGALQKGEEGTVTVAFDVHSDGRAINCRVVQSSGSPGLDSATCRLIATRFRFAPATDAAGQPVPEARRQKVRWQLPEDESRREPEKPAGGLRGLLRRVLGGGS
jgi:TonB family protein